MTSSIFFAIVFLSIFATSVLGTPLNLSINNGFPQVTTYTALGDSYAAGAGAGHPTPCLCGRFSDAYPAQLAHSLSPVRFHSAACGGASTVSVVRDQFAWIGDSDLVTLTVGGNEVDFFGVLNECVYQWLPLGGCEEELRRSRVVIESSSFVERYFRMVQLGLQRLRRGQGDARNVEKKLLVTGYATFFNEETTWCDYATFSRKEPRQFLTKHLRRELNQLVRILNHVISSAAEAAGADYVDIDPAFEGHRFCEPGVREPANSRSETWFFNLHYQSAEAFEARLGHDEAWQESFSTGLEKELGGVTRVFHPTIQGHGGIRDAIVKYLSQ